MGSLNHHADTPSSGTHVQPRRQCRSIVDSSFVIDVFLSSTSTACMIKSHIMSVSFSLALMPTQFPWFAQEGEHALQLLQWPALSRHGHEVFQFFTHKGDKCLQFLWAPWAEMWVDTMREMAASILCVPSSKEQSHLPAPLP